MNRSWLIEEALLIVVLGFIVFFAYGFDVHKQNQLAQASSVQFYPDTLPCDAKIIKNLGNGWVYFELYGRTFLFHEDVDGHEACAEISKEVY